MERLVSISALVLGLCCSALAQNQELTPGVLRGLTLEQICSTKWGRDRRLVTTAMKREVRERYDFHDKDCPRARKGPRVEIDHFYPRCMGGADDIDNLWPQCYAGEWNARMKDRLEVRVCKDICNGALDRDAAVSLFSNWKKAYRGYFGE